MEKEIITINEYKEVLERQKKGEIVPMYCKMIKGSDVIYATMMMGYFEAQGMGYEYAE